MVRTELEVVKQTVEELKTEVEELKEKFEEHVETVEILSNPETMASLARSEKDIKAGKVKKIGGVKDLLAE